MPRFFLDELRHEFGCPKEFKNGCDADWGCAKNHLLDIGKNRQVKTIQEVVAILQDFFTELNTKRRGGGERWQVFEFLPLPKPNCQFWRFTLGTLGGVADSFSFQFKTNDRRALTRGHFGYCAWHRRHDLQYLSYWNHVKTGSVGAPGRLQLELGALERVEPDEEVFEI